MTYQIQMSEEELEKMIRDIIKEELRSIREELYKLKYTGDE